MMRMRMRTERRRTEVTLLMYYESFWSWANWWAGSCMSAWDHKGWF